MDIYWVNQIFYICRILWFQKCLLSQSNFYISRILGFQKCPWICSYLIRSEVTASPEKISFVASVAQGVKGLQGQGRGSMVAVKVPYLFFGPNFTIFGTSLFLTWKFQKWAQDWSNCDSLQAWEILGMFVNVKVAGRLLTVGEVSQSF